MALGEIVVVPFGIPRKLLRSEAAEFVFELSPDRERSSRVTFLEIWRTRSTSTAS